MVLGQNPDVEWKCVGSIYYRRIAGGLVLSEMGALSAALLQHEADGPGQ